MTRVSTTCWGGHHPQCTVPDCACNCHHDTRLRQKLEAALDVAAKSYREALTTSLTDTPSITEALDIVVPDDMANWQLQEAIVKAIKAWYVPPGHRPMCPSGRPCTSWTCLVDECVFDGIEWTNGRKQEPPK